MCWYASASHTIDVYAATRLRLGLVLDYESLRLGSFYAVILSFCNMRLLFYTMELVWSTKKHSFLHYQPVILGDEDTRQLRRWIDSVRPEVSTHRSGRCGLADGLSEVADVHRSQSLKRS